MRRQRLVILGLIILVLLTGVLFLIDSIVLPRMATADAAQAFGDENYPLVEAKATVALRKYSTSNPDRLTPLALRADARLELGKPAEALEDAEEILRLAPENKTGTFYRGVARYKLGQYGDAEGDLRKVLAKDDESATTNYYLGLLAERRGDLDAARQFLKVAVQEFFKDDEQNNVVFAKKLAALSRVSRALKDTKAADDLAFLAKKLKPDVSFEIE